VRDQRPVLLIFVDKETACLEAEYLETRLKRPVQRYIINDPERQTFFASDYKLTPGEVVVSTTFGGRGTDYKLSMAAIENGGLHTVLTFYAPSLRVIDQAFGRSARAGSPGSGVLITVDSTLVSNDLFARRTEEQTTRAREYTESLSEQLKTNLPLNESCDRLFHWFATLYAFSRARFDKIRLNPVDRTHFLRALRDRFGLLIEELRHDVATQITNNKTRRTQKWIEDFTTEKFKAWRDAVVPDLKAGDKIITNSRSMIVYARELSAADVVRALQLVDRAIDSDAAFAGPAGYVLRLKFTLEKREKIDKKRFNPRKEEDFKTVKKLLEEARDAFTTEIEFVGGEHELLVQEIKGSKLDVQLMETLNVLFILRDTIYQALAELEANYEKRGQSDDDKFYLILNFIDFPDEVSELTRQAFKETLDPNGYLGPLQLETKREWAWDWYECSVSYLSCWVLSTNQLAKMPQERFRSLAAGGRTGDRGRSCFRLHRRCLGIGIDHRGNIRYRIRHYGGHQGGWYVDLSPSVDTSED
jgi:hypothetical protein